MAELSWAMHLSTGYRQLHYQEHLQIQWKRQIIPYYQKGHPYRLGRHLVV